MVEGSNFPPWTMIFLWVHPVGSSVTWENHIILWLYLKGQQDLMDGCAVRGRLSIEQ